MKIYSQVLSINTKSEFEFRDLGHDLNQAIKASGIQNGFILVKSRHTTAGICCQEADSSIHSDFLTLLNEVMPLNRKYEHSYEGNINARAHLAQGMLFGHATWAVIRNGSMDLGTWQKVFLVELFRPMRRNIDIVVVGE